MSQHSKPKFKEFETHLKFMQQENAKEIEDFKKNPEKYQVALEKSNFISGRREELINRGWNPDLYDYESDFRKYCYHQMICRHQKRENIIRITYNLPHKGLKSHSSPEKNINKPSRIFHRLSPYHGDSRNDELSKCKHTISGVIRENFAEKFNDVPSDSLCDDLAEEFINSSDDSKLKTMYAETNTLQETASSSLLPKQRDLSYTRTGDQHLADTRIRDQQLYSRRRNINLQIEDPPESNKSVPFSNTIIDRNGKKYYYNCAINALVHGLINTYETKEDFKLFCNGNRNIPLLNFISNLNLYNNREREEYLIDVIPENLKLEDPDGNYNMTNCLENVVCLLFDPFVSAKLFRADKTEEPFKVINLYPTDNTLSNMSDFMFKTLTLQNPGGKVELMDLVHFSVYKQINESKCPDSNRLQGMKIAQIDKYFEFGGYLYELFFFVDRQYGDGKRHFVTYVPCGKVWRFIDDYGQVNKKVDIGPKGFNIDINPTLMTYFRKRKL